MNENKIIEYSTLYKSQQGSEHFKKVPKKIFPTNLLLTKKNYNILLSKSPMNIKHRQSNFIVGKSKIDPFYLSRSQYIFPGADSKFRQLRLIRNSRSQKVIDNTHSSNRSNNQNIETNDKTAEKILLKKIEEVNKSLEQSENIFRYNQKIMKKKLDEKDDEINNLKLELEKEKTRKKSLYESMYNESKNSYIDEIKQLKKQLEKLNRINFELSEQNSEYENKIKNLENKNAETNTKLQEMRNKYNSLIKDKTNDILEDEIKQYISDLNIQIDSSQNELNSLNEEISYLNQENKRLKFLTKEIIEARNETEIFFLDALNDVKMELYKQKKEKIKRDCFFPKLKNFYETGNEIKVDIRELTPEIREKILRKLFEKINGGYNEQNYNELNYIMDRDTSDLQE
jgi:DNA repair exonuclease SbcCD ATPase subunit